MTAGDPILKHDERGCLWKRGKWLCDTYQQNEFVILIIVSILLAKAYPSLGAIYLCPHITSTWVIVVFIFFLAGLGLKTEEFTKALQHLKFNAFIQLFCFGVVSGVAYTISQVLVGVGALEQSLEDGLVMCGCLPMTISSVSVLTKTAGGDEAAAIFNSAFSNMNGVFLSSILMLMYLGVLGGTDLVSVFYKVSLQVVLPVLVGQIIWKSFPLIVVFVRRKKKLLRLSQQYSLVFLVYTVFCQTFAEDRTSKLMDILVMIGAQLVLFIGFNVLAWGALKVFFPHEPKLCVMGLFGCTQKMVAMGVPLIGAIYENDPNVRLYTLPLLIWYPMQLLVGAFLVPSLQCFIETEKARLGIVDYDSDNDILKKPYRKKKKTSMTRDSMEDGSMAGMSCLTDETDQDGPIEQTMFDQILSIKKTSTTRIDEDSAGDLGDPNAEFNNEGSQSLDLMEQGVPLGTLLGGDIDDDEEEQAIFEDSASLFSFSARDLTPLVKCSPKEAEAVLFESSSNLSGFWTVNKYSERRESNPRIQVEIDPKIQLVILGRETEEPPTNAPRMPMTWTSIALGGLRWSD